MTPLHLLILCAALLILGLALASGRIRNRIDVLSEPLVALLAGIAVGPVALDLVDPARLALDGDGHKVLKALAELTVAVAVFFAAVRVAPGWLGRHWRDFALLIGPLMLAMWLASSALAWAVLPLAPLMALLLGAVITPTDPVMAASIIASRAARSNVPPMLRHALSAESGANDGLALVLVMLPLMLLDGTWHGPGAFAIKVLAIKVGGALLLGAVVGGAAAALTMLAQRYDWTHRHSLTVVGFAVAMAALSAGALAGTDAILCAFGAGIAFAWFMPEDEEEQLSVFGEDVKRLFEAPMFLLLGSALPIAAWLDHGVALAGLAVGVLAVRRLPWLLGLSRLLTIVEKRRDAFYLGWFGPIGIAALYYALKVEGRLGEPLVFEITTAIIAASALAHGMTATAAAQRFGGRRAGSTSASAPQKSRSA